MGEHIRLLLVEDHALVREGTREILERDPRLRVVGEAEDGPAALAMIDDLQPDIVLIDLDLPILNGVEVIRRIRARPEGPLAIVLSAYDDEDYVLAALSAGATGYLLKTAHADELISAIHAAAGGETVLQGSVGRTLLARAQGPGQHGVLTERELEVLGLVVAGQTDREIAEALFIGHRTAQTHVANILAKLGVSSRTAAATAAIAAGIVAAPSGPAA